MFRKIVWFAVAVVVSVGAATHHEDPHVHGRGGGGPAGPRKAAAVMMVET